MPGRVRAKERGIKEDVRKGKERRKERRVAGEKRRQARNGLT